MKRFWFHFLIEMLLLIGIVFVYLHPRPVTATLPINARAARTVSVYLSTAESPLYCKEFPAQDVIPILQQITYEPRPFLITEDYTAPGCATLEIEVHYYDKDVFFLVSMTHSDLGDTVLVSTPDLFSAYGYTAYYLGTWPDSGDFWLPIGVPEAEVPYDELPSRRYLT